MAGDLLDDGLYLVFCGYNPSLASGDTGRHYAHPTNRFWALLHAAGITERLYEPGEDELLLDKGIGFTNLVSRPTRRANELQRREIEEGAQALKEKLMLHRPFAVAYTGIGVYRLLIGGRKVDWGAQLDGVVEGVSDVVVPSPSGLNRMRFEQMVEHYRPLRRFLG